MSVRAGKSVTLMVPVDIDDRTTQGFYAELSGRLRETPAELLLDCSLLEHASSTHINTLWQARNRCEEAGVPVKLTEVTYGLERVLIVLDLHHLFTAERDGVEARRGAGPAGLDAAVPLEQEVTPTVDGIAEAMSELHAYLAEINIGELLAFDIETVFYEVTTNIRIHGKLREDQPIRFTAAPREGMFNLRFEDPGPCFDPTSRATDFDPERAVRTRRRHGFGLSMIKRLMDDLTYERKDDSVNILNLKKVITGNGG